MFLMLSGHLSSVSSLREQGRCKIGHWVGICPDASQLRGTASGNLFILFGSPTAQRLACLVGQRFRSGDTVKHGVEASQLVRNVWASPPMELVSASLWFAPFLP